MISNRNIGAVLEGVERDLRGKDVPIITLQANMKRDPYRVLIATKLSLRTKDAVTAAASERLFARADTPEAMLRLSEGEIAKLIYPVGFYRTKARTILEVSRILLEKHGGVVPDEIDDLMTLPGVGRKTANLVLIEGYQKEAMCVDTHVHRISNRWGYVRTKTPEQTEMALRKKLPREHWALYNELLVGFGQHRCQPVSPWCSSCPLSRDCPRKGVARSR